MTRQFILYFFRLSLDHPIFSPCPILSPAKCPISFASSRPFPDKRSTAYATRDRLHTPAHTPHDADIANKHRRRLRKRSISTCLALRRPAQPVLWPCLRPSALCTIPTHSALSYPTPPLRPPKDNPLRCAQSLRRRWSLAWREDKEGRRRRRRRCYTETRPRLGNGKKRRETRSTKIEKKRS